MPAHALEPLQGCTSVTECSDVQLHERLLSLPVGCLQMNAGFQVAACPRCSPVLSFCSPSVNQGQALGLCITQKDLSLECLEKKANCRFWLARLFASSTS